MVGAGRLTEPAAHGRGEIVLEDAPGAGQHPFTASVATGPAPSAATPATGETAPGLSGATAAVITTVRGSQPGFYGGTRNAASCDAQRLIEDLQKTPAHAAAWAEVEGITPQDIPSFADADVRGHVDQSLVDDLGSGLCGNIGAQVGRGFTDGVDIGGCPGHTGGAQLSRRRVPAALLRAPGAAESNTAF